jgi:hypothetical protein
MREHDPRLGAASNSGEGHRSHLLTPVIAGATFQDDDVMGFLAGRLTFVPDDDLAFIAEDDIEATMGWTGKQS